MIDQAYRHTPRPALRLGALLLTVLLLLGTLASCGAGFSYLETDLSSYLTLEEKDYKGLSFTVKLDPVTDLKVEERILQLQYQNRAKDAVKDGASFRNQTVTPGDVLSIYYQGYELDGEGNKVYLDGTCNFSSGLAELGIGSGDFISGFEIGLLGKNPKDYSALQIATGGTVGETDVIYADYVVLQPNSSKFVSYSNVRLDMREDLDAVYGKGFREKLLGKEVGKQIAAFATDAVGEERANADSIAYSDFKINYKTTGEDSPIVVKTRFPYNYQSEELRLKTVYFNVWIDTAVLYDAPAFDDAFVTKTLGMTEEELSAFEGETLTDRAKASIRATLTEEYEDAKRTLAEEALWEHMKKAAAVKKLPEAEVEKTEREYLDDLQEKYEYYSNMYGSTATQSGLASFATEYYGLDGTVSYTDYIRSQAEDVVKEKLIFYHILRKEDKLPTGETLERLYNESVDEALAYYLSQSQYDKDNYDSEEKYEAAVAALRSDIIEYYGEEYFREQAYYGVLMEYLVGLLEIVVDTPSDYL